MKTTRIEQHNTVRLVDSRCDREDSDHALMTLAGGNDSATAMLLDLTSMTSGRTRAEAGDNPQIPRNFLVSAVPLASVVNAAFAYPAGSGTGGARFNDESVGAWYCSDTIAIAKAEVEHHRGRFLADGRLSSAQMAFTAYLADFNSDMVVLARTSDASLLDPHAYGASQQFAHQCRAGGTPAIRYPCVRRSDGQNIAALAPSIVQNVRRGLTYDVHWAGGVFTWARGVRRP